MKTRTIEIDIDVHKAIELAREDFNETDNSVLRRMLGIDVDIIPKASNACRPWVGKGYSSGLTLPHGTELRLQYNTTNLAGVVDDGALVFNGERFSSPSGTRKLCRTKDGRIPHLNGKTIIEARLPETSDWIRLDALERRMNKEAQAL